MTHGWARDLWHAGTYLFIGGAAVSVFAALTGLWDARKSSEAGTQARRTINTHATIMVTVTVLALVDITWRLNSYHTELVTPVGIMALSVVIALLVSLGATFGGALVYEYGFNVETAGDSSGLAQVRDRRTGMSRAQRARCPDSAWTQRQRCTPEAARQTVDRRGVNPPDGAVGSAFRQVVVDVEIGGCGLSLDAHSCVTGAIFFSGTSEVLLRLPHFCHSIPSSVFVTQWNSAPRGTGATRLQTHPVDDLVVLLERHAGNIRRGRPQPPCPDPRAAGASSPACPGQHLILDLRRWRRPCDERGDGLTVGLTANTNTTAP